MLSKEFCITCGVLLHFFKPTFAYCYHGDEVFTGVTSDGDITDNIMNFCRDNVQDGKTLKVSDSVAECVGTDVGKGIGIEIKISDVKRVSEGVWFTQEASERVPTDVNTNSPCQDTMPPKATTQFVQPSDKEQVCHGHEMAIYLNDKGDSKRNTRDQSDDKGDKGKPDTDAQEQSLINVRTLTVTTVVVRVIDITSTITHITVTEQYAVTETRFRTTTMPRKHKTIKTTGTETETTETTNIIESTIAATSSSTSSSSRSEYTAFNAYVLMDPNDNGCF